MIDEHDLPIDPELEELDEYLRLQRQVYELEDRISSKEMSLEDQLRSSLIREAEQRILIRKIVIGICVVVLVFMGFLGLHATHQVQSQWFWNLTIPQAYLIALLVAPIASISVVTVALLVGAFRQFREGDSSSLTGAVSDWTKAGIGQ